VVCTANIARSPLAEVLIRGHLDHRGLGYQLAVDSAGTRARVGDAAAEHSRRIAARWGLTLEEHRSKPVDADLVVGSDLVITMSERQRDHLGATAAGAAQRCFTLKELVRLLESRDPAPSPAAAVDALRGGVEAAHHRRAFSRAPDVPEDVDDPFGGPFGGYAHMANELVDLTERLIPSLLGEDGAGPR
jgi:protein-tyrosine phosphatase